MKRWMLTGEKELRLEDCELGELRPGWARLVPQFCGICGSDLHSYQGKHPLVHPPIVLGHEFSAIVESVASGTAVTWVGRHVVVEPSIPCGACFACQHGAYHICHNLQVIGNIGHHGALAERVDVPVDRLIALPSTFPLDVAALVEPTAVAVHALRRITSLDGGLVIMGAGPIGMLTGLVAKAIGISPILAVDIRAERLQQAQQLGIDYGVNPREEFVPALVRSRCPDGPAAVLDCVATSATLNMALEIARKGTSIVLVGVPEGPLNVDAVKIQDRELSVVGTLMYQRTDFESAIDLLHGEKIPGRALISRIVPFDKVALAYEQLVTNSGQDMKVLIKI